MYLPHTEFEGMPRMTPMPGAMIVPLRTGEHGVLYVGSTRVTLDSVIYAFRRGVTPETIVEKYPVLGLADVYLVTAWYLQHSDEAEAYLLDQEIAAHAQRISVEQDFPATGLRARLLERMEKSRAP